MPADYTPTIEGDWPVSTDIIEIPGLIVTLFAGPAELGTDRRMYQFTSLRGDNVLVLTHSQLVQLVPQLAAYVINARKV